MEESASELELQVARLTRELGEARAQQAATADVLKAISSSGFELDAVLTTLIRSAIELCEAARGVIWLRRGEKLFLAAHVDYPPEWVDFANANPITPSADAQTTSGLAVFTGEVVNVGDIFADPRFRSLAGHALGNYRAGLAVPLKRGGTVVGAISLSRPEVGLFTERQVALVETFADQAVIAIENARLFGEVQTRNRELSEALEQQVATSAILRVIAASPTDIQPVLDAVAENAAQLCDAQDASIMLRRGDVLTVVSHQGTIPIDYAELPLVRGMVGGRAVLDRAPVHVHDMEVDREFPGSRVIALRLGVRTLLAAPLMREDEAIGVVLIRRIDVRPFSERQIELLQTFADQAVIAIANVRLFEEVQSRNRELSEALEQQTATSAILQVIASSPTDIQPVLKAVTESAAQLCDAYDATTFFRRGDVLEVGAHHGSISVDFGDLPVARDVVSGRAVLNREPVHVHDLWAAGEEFATGRAIARRIGFRTILATPLMREGEAIGALMIRRSEVRPFSDKQIALLKTFADQAVIAIENVRLFEEVQARNRDLTESLERQTAMSDILRVISRSPTDVQPVFETIAESAARLCGGHFCTVFRFDGKLIHFVAQHGLPPEGVEEQRRAFPKLPGRGSGASRAILSAAVEQIPDVSADPDYQVGETARAIGARSVLAVPMLRDGRPVGTINIGRAEPGYFPPRQVELLQTFADQAVIAIENVRLFEEVQARTNELEGRTRELTESLQQQTATADVLKVISRSTFDLQTVLDTLLESASRLCRADKADIVRFVDGEFQYVALYGYSPELERYVRSHPLEIGRGSANGRAMAEKRTVHIADVRDDPEYRMQDLAEEGNFRTVLSVPLLREGSLIGIIALLRSEPQPFSEKEIDLVTTFADQAVIAIENVRLFTEVGERNRELSEALQQQTATADVLKVISRSAFDLDPVLQTLIESAIRLCGAEKGVITLREGDYLRFKAGSGQSPELREYEATHPHKLGRGTFQGRAAIEGTTIHIPDVLDDPEYERKEAMIVHDVRANLCVPLKRGAEVIGVFGLAKAAAGPFAPRQIELVETFADQAVIAIENARLFEEVQARTRELQDALEQQTATSEVLGVISRSTTDLQPVLDAIVTTAARLCGVRHAFIWSMEAGAGRLVATYSDALEFVKYQREHPAKPERGNLPGRVLAERRTVHIHDALADPEYTDVERLQAGGCRTLLGVPLLRKGEPIGIMTFMHDTVRPFSDKQIELIETFADQAVIAIENVRLFDEVQARTSELSESLKQQTATADVLKAISRSTFDLQPVLDTLVESAAKLCEADNGVIFKRDGDVYRWSAHYGHTAEMEAHSIANPQRPGRSSLTSRVALEARTVHISDVTVDREYAAIQQQRLGAYRTALGVPILREGSPVGVFALGRLKVRDFTPRQIELVETFADQAAIAIENVRLFEEVQARTAELGEALQQQTATADVLKVISRSAFDLQTVLDTLLESAARLCRADKGGIVRIQNGIFRYVASHGYPPAFRDYIDRHPPPAGRGSVVGRVVSERRIVQIEDVRNDPDYVMTPASEVGDFHTALGVPLMREDDFIGVFVLTRTEIRPFSSGEIELVTTFADQAVIAIENVRLFDEVQARTDELSRSLEDLRTAQDRLIQTEKLASLGQLTAGIAHEIKNPLNFVNNFSSLSGELIDELRETLANVPVGDKLRAELAELSDMLKSNLEKVVQHGRRADSIVKNMLLHSRAGSGDHRPSDINAIVEESLNLAYHGARAEKQGFNITMEKSLDPSAGEVDLYPQEITRVLLNLIANGFYAATKRKAQADGGGFEPVLAATTKSLGDSVEIRIRDNGTGIPQEVKEKMFNPFFTTKPAGEGTGLGLSLSHDIIVKQHAGTIEVETEPGAFTEFRIVLPRGAASLGKSGGNA